MKTKIFLLVLFLLTTQVATAQIMFEKTYGGTDVDQGLYVKQTLDTGYIVVGSTFSYGEGSSDVYLIKTNKYGDTIWTRTYGGTGWDFGGCVKQTMDGGYIISGKTSSFGWASQVFLIRINSVGDTLWTRTFGGAEGEGGGSVIENIDGSFIVVGNTLSYATGFSAVYINKTDADGLLLWSKVYEKLSVSGAGDVHKTNDGYYLVSGFTYNMGDNYNSMLYILKIKDNGDTIWTKTIANPDGGLSGAKISLTNDNSIIFTGTLFYANGEAKLYMMKTDTICNLIWFKKFGGKEYVGGGNSFQTNDGGFILTGVTGNVAKGLNSSDFNNELLSDSLYSKMFANGDLYLLRTNSNGDSLWSRVYGGTGDDVGNSVQQTNDNGFIVCGYTTINLNTDFYIIKTNNEGCTGIKGNYTGVIDFNLYPNPSTGIFQIQLNGNRNESLQIEVINYSGQIILYKTIAFNEKNQIDLTAYGSGLYLIHFIYKNGVKFSQTLSHKVIVQN